METMLLETNVSSSTSPVDTETNRNNTPGEIIEGDFGIPYTINIGKNDVRIYRYCLEPDDFYLDKKLKKDLRRKTNR